MIDGSCVNLAGGVHVENRADANDTESLTTRIADGDPDAFATLYRAKFDLVYRAALRSSSLGEDACLDIVQDTMMRVIRYMRPFDADDALDRWLRCVTRSVAYDHLRRERRRRTREREAVDHRVEPDANESHAITERINWVRRELRGLDRAAAEIFELRYRAGLTLESVGQHLGLTVGAVHGRLARAVAKLRNRTSELGDD